MRSHTDRSVSWANPSASARKSAAEVVPASTDAQASSTSTYRSSGVIAPRSASRPVEQVGGVAGR